MKITKGTRVAYRYDPHTEVTVIDYESNGNNFPIVTRGPSGPLRHTDNGQHWNNGRLPDFDLVPCIPKPEKVCGWANVYLHDTMWALYETRDKATKNSIAGQLIRQAYMVEQEPPEGDA